MTERISPLLVDKKEKTMIVFEFFFDYLPYHLRKDELKQKC